MLILTCHNVYTDDQDVADYNFMLYINHTPIAAGMVVEHPRARGAAELLRRVADEMDNQKASTPRVGGEEETFQPKVKAQPLKTT